jgi:hypothetical protein
MTEEPEVYQRMLQSLISKAQQVWGPPPPLFYLVGCNTKYYRNSGHMHFVSKLATDEMLENFKLVLTCCLCCRQCNNEKLLENPYLQMRGILQLSNDLGVQ